MKLPFSLTHKMYLRHYLLASVVITFIRNTQSLNFLDVITNFFNNDQTEIVNKDDANLNIQELALKYKYNLEKHEVVTEDGYKLSVHRFGNNKSGIPILLMHGILDSADSWILQGPGNSLGHILADQGFDVWLGNARGNKYSSSHVELNNTDRKYWNFTWEEIGLYDLPATIDYILNVTRSNYLYYVGHSQGTTAFYVMNAMKPEYNKKIRLMFALAPVAWMKNIDNPLLRYISQFFASFTSIYDVYTSSTSFLQWISNLCSILSSNCGNVFSTFVGADNGLIQKSFLPIIFGHYPSSASTLQLIHYGQLINSGRFLRFDYGEQNIKRYGTNVPPDYNLSDVRVPVVMFYSRNDKLSHPIDVMTLCESLPNVRAKYNMINFNHFDYMYASIAKDEVYVKIIYNIWKFESDSAKNKFGNIKGISDGYLIFDTSGPSRLRPLSMIINGLHKTERIFKIGPVSSS